MRLLNSVVVINDVYIQIRVRLYTTLRKCFVKHYETKYDKTDKMGDILV